MDRRSDEVFLTGGTGFVGSHVLAALLAAGYSVRALVRAGTSLPSLDGCTSVEGDLRNPGSLTHHLKGCRYLIHVAALYSFDRSRSSDIWSTNVNGTAGLLEAGRIAGVERAVVTSSSATLGPTRDGVLATEDDWAADSDHRGYHQSKLAQERAALAAQLPAVLVLPTAPVGPGDWKPTPTGKMILDFMQGRIFGSLAGGLNVVPVEDVARGHVLALQRGRDRERYVLGGENFSLTALWEALGSICGRPPPTRTVPYSVALAFSAFDEVRARLFRQEPVAPVEGVRMGRERMFVSWEKARDELGYEAGSAHEALSRAVSWYRDNGYVA